MPLFKYEVTEANGRVLIGAMDALSEADLRARLMAKGYRVNAVFTNAPPQAAPAQAVPRPQAQQTSGVSAPAKELSVFFRGLASFLHSGISLNQALIQIGVQTPSRGLRVICERMAARIQVGQRLSDAMAEFPRAFPPHVVGVVAAGELGGFLPVVVGDIALNYELEQRASNRYSKWVALMLWINAVGTLLLAPFVPLMFGSAATMDSEKPADYLRVGFVAWWHYIMHYMVPPLALFYLVYFTIKVVLNQPSMRARRDALVLRAPMGIGRASKLRSLAGFSRILWRLQQAGILPIQAWDAASRSAENQIVGARLYQQVDAVRSGKKFSEALAATGLFRSDDCRVLSLGETSGSMNDTLQRVAEYYEDAALSAAGRLKWVMTRIAIWANIFVAAYAFYCIEAKSTMSFMDQFMKE